MKCRVQGEQVQSSFSPSSTFSSALQLSLCSALQRNPRAGRGRVYQSHCVCHASVPATAQSTHPHWRTQVDEGCGGGGEG